MKFTFTCITCFIAEILSTIIAIPILYISWL